MRYILTSCLFVACRGGSDGRYSFSVMVSSRETGCGRFADWWEVLNENGERPYRRV